MDDALEIVRAIKRLDEADALKLLIAVMGREAAKAATEQLIAVNKLMDEVKNDRLS